MKYHLSNIFKAHSDLYSTYNIKSVEEFLNSPLPVSRHIKHITPNEVKYTNIKYTLNKSTGFHQITVEIARCLPKNQSSISHIYSMLFLDCSIFQYSENFQL